MYIVHEKSEILETIIQQEQKKYKFVVRNADNTITEVYLVELTASKMDKNLAFANCVQQTKLANNATCYVRCKGFFKFSTNPLTIEFVEGNAVITNPSFGNSSEQEVTIHLQGAFKNGKLWIGNIRISPKSAFAITNLFPHQNFFGYYKERSSASSSTHPWILWDFKTIEGVALAYLSVNAFNESLAFESDKTFQASELISSIEFSESEAEYLLQIKQTESVGTYVTDSCINGKPLLVYGEKTDYFYERDKWIEWRKFGLFNENFKLDSYFCPEQVLSCNETMLNHCGSIKLFIFGRSGTFSNGCILSGYHHWNMFNANKKTVELAHYFGDFIVASDNDTQPTSKFNDVNGRLYMINEAKKLNVMLNFKLDKHQNENELYEIDIDQNSKFINFVRKLVRKDLFTGYEEEWRAHIKNSKFEFKSIKNRKLSQDVELESNRLCTIFITDLLHLALINRNYVALLAKDDCSPKINESKLLQDELLNEYAESVKAKARLRLDKRSAQRLKRAAEESRKMSLLMMEQKSTLFQKENTAREALNFECNQYFGSIFNQHNQEKIQIISRPKKRSYWSQTNIMEPSSKSLLHLTLLPLQNNQDNMSIFYKKLLNENNLLLEYERYVSGSRPLQIIKFVSDQMNTNVHHFYLIMYIKDPNVNFLTYLNMIFRQPMRKNHQVQGKVEKSVYSINNSKLNTLLLSERYEGIFECLGDYSDRCFGIPVNIITGRYSFMQNNKIQVYQVENSELHHARFVESCDDIPNALPQLTR